MNTFVALLKIVPTLVTIVKTIEDVIPFSGKGKEKCSFILDLVTQISAEVKDIPCEILKVHVTTIVTLVVRLFNATGVFRNESV